MLQFLLERRHCKGERKMHREVYESLQPTCDSDNLSRSGANRRDGNYRGAMLLKLWMALGALCRAVVRRLCKRLDRPKERRAKLTRTEVWQAIEQRFQFAGDTHNTCRVADQIAVEVDQIRSPFTEMVSLIDISKLQLQSCPPCTQPSPLVRFN